MRSAPKRRRRNKRSTFAEPLVPLTTLVSADALRARLDDPRIVIVDCRHSLADVAAGRAAYEAGHIPEAIFADAETDLSGEKTGRNGRHPLPDPQRFGDFLRAHGAGDDTQLVAYDAGGDMFAARFWVLSRWIGHDAVAVLDGGFAAWQARGYPITDAPPRVRAAGSLTVRLRPDAMVDAAFVLQHLGDDAVQVLDARGEDRFAGLNESVDPVAGHIPGAHNRWYRRNFNADGTFQSRQALREQFLAESDDPERIVHQCGSGVSAAVNQLAMEIAGLSGSRLYAGSWSEWIADPSRPIATGPA